MNAQEDHDPYSYTKYFLSAGLDDRQASRLDDIWDNVLYSHMSFSVGAKVYKDPCCAFLK